MPVLNADPYLAEAIESILAQSYTNFEFIIIDDGSTDRSVEIVQQYAQHDARIRPLFLAHKGAAGALNAGVAAARGELIARMDADDVALPERFARQIAWMNQREVDICGSCIKTFDTEQRIMWFPETHDAICRELVFRCAFMHPTVIMRAEIAKRHPYDESLYFEDYELWTRLAPLYRLGNMPQILLKYRVHPRQLHITRAVEVRSELKTYSERHYKTLYPESSAAEIAVLQKLVLNEPMESVRALEHAGTLLVRLAACPDRFVRERMAHRWWQACRLSANLGVEVLRVRSMFNRQFGVQPSSRSTAWLIFASLFRLHADSPFERSIRNLRGKLFAS